MMEPAIKEQILDDDNEVMTSALDSDLDEENKELNRRLIARHERITAKVEKSGKLTWDELLLVADANQIHLNDEQNLAGWHAEAVKLDAWLEEQARSRTQDAVKVLERHLDKNPCTPARAYRALHILWEEATCSQSHHRVACAGGRT